MESAFDFTIDSIVGIESKLRVQVYTVLSRRKNHFLYPVLSTVTMNYNL